MIREAAHRDIPYLAQCWYQEKAKTCFNLLGIEWSVAGCASFLVEALADPWHVILVNDEGAINAACGAILQKNLLPPHPLVIGEWMWWGSDKRAVVQVLHAVNQWGKQRGATLAQYTLNQPGQSPTKFSETYRWEVL